MTGHQKQLRKLKVLRFQLALSILSLALTLTAFSSITFSWFSFVKQASIINNNVTVDTPFKYTTQVEIDDEVVAGDQFNFYSFFPGNVHKKRLKITIRNDDVIGFYADWYFKMPTQTEEIPFTDTTGIYGSENYYYYFGSQIQLSSIDVTIDGNTTYGGAGEGQYLVTTDSTGLTKGQVNGVADQVAFTDHFLILEDMFLAGGKTAYLTFVITFVDNHTNQNVFQNEEFTCSRQIFLYLTPEE